MLKQLEANRCYQLYMRSLAAHFESYYLNSTEPNEGFTAVTHGCGPLDSQLRTIPIGTVDARLRKCR